MQRPLRGGSVWVSGRATESLTGGTAVVDCSPKSFSRIGLKGLQQE